MIPSFEFPYVPDRDIRIDQQKRLDLYCEYYETTENSSISGGCNKCMDSWAEGFRAAMELIGIKPEDCKIQGEE